MTDSATAQMQRLRTELQQVRSASAATSERVVQTAPASGIGGAPLPKGDSFSTSMAHPVPHW
jgi:hypothetical protein